MSDNQYVKPPKDSVLKKALGAIKGGYAYLHPDYRTRKLLQLIVVAPIVFFADAILYGLCIAPHLPAGYPRIIDTIVVIIVPIISAYFYPYASWWYKQGLGTTFDNMIIIGTFTGVMIRKMCMILFDVILTGVLSPIIGPLVLRKCKKRNMIIGEEGDF